MRHVNPVRIKPRIQDIAAKGSGASLVCTDRVIKALCAYLITENKQYIAGELIALMGSEEVFLPTEAQKKACIKAYNRVSNELGKDFREAIKDSIAR